MDLRNHVFSNALCSVCCFCCWLCVWYCLLFLVVVCCVLLLCLFVFVLFVLCFVLCCVGLFCCVFWRFCDFWKSTWQALGTKNESSGAIFGGLEVIGVGSNLEKRRRACGLAMALEVASKPESKWPKFCQSASNATSIGVLRCVQDAASIRALQLRLHGVSCNRDATIRGTVIIF